MALTRIGMQPGQPTIKYVATVCMSCHRASLVPQRTEPELQCSRCGTESRLVPGAEYAPAEKALFDALEQVLDRAKLTPAASALLAADLEAVSSRWEPPELVLARVSRRLPGLEQCYIPQQNYGRLLLVVSMLLTMFGARLQFQTRPKWHDSGIRPRYCREQDEGRLPHVLEQSRRAK